MGCLHIPCAGGNKQKLKVHVDVRRKLDSPNNNGSTVPAAQIWWYLCPQCDASYRHHQNLKHHMTLLHNLPKKAKFVFSTKSCESVGVERPLISSSSANECTRM